MSKPSEVGDIVSCRWLDAHANAKEELSSDEIDRMGSYQFTTYGVLVRDDRTLQNKKDPIVALAAEVGEDGRFRGVTFIPASWVVSIALIKSKLKPKVKRAKKVPATPTPPTPPTTA